ncbi:response regulator [Sporomusa aerivorans]|uniref:response regulator n=1 Tax=Sporomusa aerivorans TaxID=204936 RepID=UPI00352A0B63
MSAKINVLIADDMAATRESICELLALDKGIQVVGQAATGAEAVEMVKTLQPDVVLMDINMPGMDGITATRQIAAENPHTCIVVMSVQGELEYIKKAIAAGAKNFLIKPFMTEKLLSTIKAGYAKERQGDGGEPLNRREEQGKIITVYSSKGGTGKTTIATNLAVALAAETGEQVGIVDADLQFGDVALFLSLIPRATIADLVCDIEKPDRPDLKGYLSYFNRDVQLLPAPNRPEQAATITGSHLTAILETMRKKFRYTVIDTAAAYSENMLAVLDAADIVLVVAALDLPTIKNVKLCLEVMESRKHSPGKVKVILNKVDIAEQGINIDEIEESLQYKVTATIPNDTKVVVASVNRGVPFVFSHPDTPVAHSLFDLARLVAGSSWREQEPPLLGAADIIKRLLC